MIYDSGAFVLVPARKKSLRMALCFCEASQLARTSRRHMPPAHIYDTLCDTPFYMVSSDVQVVCTGSLSVFRYAVNFVDGYSTSATTSCGQSLKLQRNWRRLYRIYSRLGRRIGRIISDLKVALEGALAVFVWIWVAINAIIVETVASLEWK